MADFTIRDNNTKIRITCLKRDGSFFNLTGHTVKMRFRIRNIDHGPVTMTIINAIGGVAEYAMRGPAGIVITNGVNSGLYFQQTIGPLSDTYNILAGTYLTPQALARQITAQMTPGVNIIGVTCSYDILTRLFSFNSLYYLVDFHFQLAGSIGPTLGFDVKEYRGVQEAIATNTTAASFAGSDLAEEGIMYAEFEIRETSTGNLVSSSEITTFVVRGKVTDE